MNRLGWKPKRFTDDGEYVGEDVQQTVTPPDRLEALAREQHSNGVFPDLEQLLSIPMPQIIRLVKSKAEANVLCQIRQLSSQLSTLIHFLTQELQSSEVRNITNDLIHLLHDYRSSKRCGAN